MGRRMLTRIITLQLFHHKNNPHTQPQEPHEEQEDLKQPSLDSLSHSSWHDDEEDEDEDDYDDECTLTRCSSSRSALSMDKSVRFGECQVRRYSQVLGDHPYCSMGCPLELGWDFEQERTKSVNDFEAQKGRRSKSELLLSPEERRKILSACESEPNLRKACRRRASGKKIQRKIQREFFST